MDKDIHRFSLRTNSEILNKLRYIAKHEQRTANKQLEYAVQLMIRSFEAEYGKITSEQINELCGSKKLQKKRRKRVYPPNKLLFEVIQRENRELREQQNIRENSEDEE